MLRSTVAAAALLLSTPVFAAPGLASARDGSPPRADRAPMAQVAADSADALLARLGPVRRDGAHFEVTVSHIYDRSGAEAFLAWRHLADTLATAGHRLERHTVVITAYAPSSRRATTALQLGNQRAAMLRQGLEDRGIDIERMQIQVARGTRAERGVEYRVRFEAPPVAQPVVRLEPEVFQVEVAAATRKR